MGCRRPGQNQASLATLLPKHTRYVELPIREFEMLCNIDLDDAMIFLFQNLSFNIFCLFNKVTVFHYFICYLGLIFVVDSNDRERANEARDELSRMLGEDELREAVLLVFANKQV